MHTSKMTTSHEDIELRPIPVQCVVRSPQSDTEDDDVDCLPSEVDTALTGQTSRFRKHSPRNAGRHWTAVKVGLKTSVSNFFGVGDDDAMAKWQDRVQRMHATSGLVGRGYKQQQVDTPDCAVPDTAPVSNQLVTTAHIRDPFRRPEFVSRQVSGISTTSVSRRFGRMMPTPQPGRESVLQMAVDGFKTLVSTSARKGKPVTAHSRSLAPLQINQVQEMGTPATAHAVTPGTDSVFQSVEDALDDVFYEDPMPTSTVVNAVDEFPSLRLRRNPGNTSDGSQAGSSGFSHPLSAAYYEMPSVSSDRPTKAGWQPGRLQPEPLPAETPSTPFPALPTTASLFEGMSRIDNSLIRNISVIARKRQIGKGFIGFLTDAEYRQSRIDANVHQQMVALNDHRPFFTYWVTFVQIVCFIVSVAVYGISPIGISVKTVESEVLKSNLAIEKSHYFEDSNMWIGPRQADLIHLGAKYSPCMRRDENVEHAIASDRHAESQTACCIRNDQSGCVQASRSNCSAILATWKVNSTRTNGRITRTVCGLDARFCKNPPDMEEFWPDDITQWPVCQDAVELLDGSPADDHMTCKIQGRPCCIGIQGECIITTREHCKFLRGYFHQENTLCAQVSCMNEICGMIPFINSSHPDQFYRLFISLFIHVGLLQLIITVLFQFFIMRDLEKLAGSLRIGIIYIASGIAGSLSSAIFLPYHVEAGPTGSQFGLLACLFVEVIQNWYILTSPLLALGRLSGILLVLFAVGVLPMIDNYAHLIGFMFGFLLAFALLPYITFNVFDRRGKSTGIVICLVCSAGLFVGLFALFYIAPLYNCPHCHYFNCVPITADFCRSMEVRIGRYPPWYS